MLCLYLGAGTSKPQSLGCSIKGSHRKDMVLWYSPSQCKRSARFLLAAGAHGTKSHLANLKAVGTCRWRPSRPAVGIPLVSQRHDIKPLDRIKHTPTRTITARHRRLLHSKAPADMGHPTLDGLTPAELALAAKLLTLYPLPANFTPPWMLDPNYVAPDMGPAIIIAHRRIDNHYSAIRLLPAFM